MAQRFLSLVDRVVARSKTTLFVACLIGIGGLPFAVLLYSNLRSSMEELLPKNAASIAALNVLHERFGDNMQMSMLVTGAPSPQLHEFADELAARASRLPSSQAPRYVDYHPAEMQSFFMDRRLLFADLADLDALDARVEARLEYERQRQNPFNLGLDEEEPPTFDDLIERYKQRAGALKVHPSGYYEDSNGQVLAMVFYPGRGVAGYEGSLGFRDTISDLAHAVAREMKLPLKIEFGGDVMAVIQEQRSLVSDLLTSSLIVLLLVSVLLFGFFRWRASVFALGFPLAIGTVATLAIGYVAIGSLNASTAFLGSIIIGNGINPGIILLARFIEERRAGTPGRAAMSTAVHKTLMATLVASLAASLAYAALMTTTFRGYSQFGFIGGVGMVLCWLATYLLVPPLGLLLDAHWPVRPHRSGKLVERFFARLGSLGVERPQTVGTAMVVILVASAAGVLHLARDPFEHDTTKLRSSWATEPGGYIDVNRRVDAILGRYLTPAVVLTDTAAEIPEVAKAYKAVINRGAKDSLIGSVMTLQSLVPDQQEEKIARIEKVRAKLTPSVRAQLDDKTRKLVDAWLPEAALHPFSVTDLPESVRRQFRERDGTEGRVMLIFPRHGTDTTDGRVLQRLAREVRSIPLPATASLASSFLILADMYESIGRDGPRATVLALAAVVLLTLLLAGAAGAAKGTFAVTASLLIGVIATVGFSAACGERINFLNFIALPITFGIGVDYAANVYGRFKLGPPTRQNLIDAVSQSGAAVACCSATTVIGYSSLLGSRNGALFSFGMLAVLGEIACLATALIILPYILRWRLEAPALATTNGGQPATEPDKLAG